MASQTPNQLNEREQVRGPDPDGSGVVNIPVRAHPTAEQQQIWNRPADEENPRFGRIRDRLFQAMLVRLSLPYHQNVPHIVRRFFEFLTLANASVLLAVLIYTHFLLHTYPARCLNEVRDDWPRKGILRLEVIQNLAEFRENQARQENVSSFRHCHFDLAEILRKGVLPDEMRNKSNNNANKPIMSNKLRWGRVRFERPLPIWFDMLRWLVDRFNQFWKWDEVENWEENEYIDGHQSPFKHTEQEDDDNVGDYSSADGQGIPIYHNLVEFSLHYGLLKLSMEMRNELEVDTMLVQLDPEQDVCFKDWRERFLMRYLIGKDELILSSVKQLLENETERGYLRDLIGGELYHFVSIGPSSSSTYLTSLIVMLIFTFAISLLLRFSHDQIFVFIVDLFQMFEQNQPLFFPIAPLLTVILALVGMEAIMSEIFNDTTTAFYVILLVWMADQYDAIFCHSPVGRRHWLRFFYLYHFAFYAYQYRYNGLYGGLALLTSAAFTFHSMVFFYHRYELPYIILQEQLNEVADRLQNEPETGTDDTVNQMHTQQNLRTASNVQNELAQSADGIGLRFISGLADSLNTAALRALESIGRRSNERASMSDQENHAELIGGRMASEIVDETMDQIDGMTMHGRGPNSGANSRESAT